MKKTTLSRRTLLRNTVHLAVVGSAPILLQACEKAELHCDDASGLDAKDAELRRQLEYRDDSPHGESKNCANCAFYVVAKRDECGGCTLVKGPIHPLGYCSSWAMKG
jgi:hypothetical protein